MFPAKFDYHRPSSVQEAVQLLQDSPDAKVLAGGHSLLPVMKMRLAAPAALVDIGRIADLKEIRAQGAPENGSLIIGATVTYHELSTSDEIGAAAPLLAEAAAQIGDRQVRYRGTLGGNVSHADPASDLPAATLALDARFHIMGPDGRRTVEASDFFVDLMMTSLGTGEILTAVEIPVNGGNTGSAYLKFEHPASGYAICGAAALITVNPDGTCARARLCYNGVSVKPFSAGAVADALRGSDLNNDAIDEAVDQHLDVPDPTGDMFASAEYRQQLARSYGKKALKAARDKVKG